jgi:hypothetical protein
VGLKGMGSSGSNERVAQSAGEIPVLYFLLIIIRTIIFVLKKLKLYTVFKASLRDHHHKSYWSKVKFRPRHSSGG